MDEKVAASADDMYFTCDEQVKVALESCLDSINSSDGSFTTSGRCDEISPGLTIDGLGTFGHPLSEAEIRRIIDTSRQAPFGKGSDTIVDTSVRNTWKIDASRLVGAWAQDPMESTCRSEHPRSRYVRSGLTVQAASLSERCHVQAAQRHGEGSSDVWHDGDLFAKPARGR